MTRVSRARRIAAYLASDTHLSFREWVAAQDHPDRLAGKLWPLGVVALIILACIGASVAVLAKGLGRF